MKFEGNADFFVVEKSGVYISLCDLKYYIQSYKLVEIAKTLKTYFTVRHKVFVQDNLLIFSLLIRAF